MQTFLPYADFKLSASCLDRQRLGKQRVECLQILHTLFGVTDGWKNHPAVRMWRGYEQALISYGSIICDEWTTRGYKDTCKGKILSYKSGNVVYPKWLGDRFIHLSHQANLLRKNYAHYSQFGWSVSPMEGYIWP